MASFKTVLASPNRPKIGVVLGGGGIRPFAGIELLEFFEENQIPIDLLVGCSGGGIIATLKGLGYTVAQMREAVHEFVNRDLFKLDYHTLAAFMHMPFTHFRSDKALLKAEGPQKILSKLFGKHRLENQLIKTLLQATDMETGKGVLLDKGNLASCVYASMAIMPFFPPILINGCLLADGLFSSPLPVLAAVLYGVDVIICVDFSARISHEISHYLGYFDDFMNLSARNIIHFQNSLAVDLHHYEIIFMEVEFDKAIFMWQTRALEQISKRGKIAVDKFKGPILEAIEAFPRRAGFSKQ